MLAMLEALVPRDWQLVPGYRMVRLQRRAEAVVLAPGAVLVFARERAAAEAAAVDLADFHAGCAGMPVIPVAVLERERVAVQSVMPLAGAAPVVATSRLLLPGLFGQVGRFPAVRRPDAADWAAAEYRPMPGLLQAARALYAGHGAASLVLAGSGRGDLVRARGAVTAALGRARAEGRRVAVFVTGHPGAGKTLCGLDLAFDPAAPSVFLTGNPALLHVLRATLVDDAVERGTAQRAARQRVTAVIQPLHAFRDAHVAGRAAPPDRVLVLDEAQRCWTAEHAQRKTRNRPVKLSDSEPGHLLDIAARHDGWAAVVCLVGGGQEIHAGEGGLAAWGAALAARPGWSAAAPPCALEGEDARQTLPPLPGLAMDQGLHLGRAVRAWRTPRLVGWVNAVLGNAPGEAARIAGDDLPVRLTRSLPAMREHLRGLRGRAGLLASSGARRLRAEGLGGLLWHQDEDAVADWFLEEWPDVRSSQALEVAATEFGAQGLELDHAGICWDLDLARTADGAGWQARSFRATAWTVPREPETASNRLNAYRVLLTRARGELVLWVPLGDGRDETRDPARYGQVASYLRLCGARPLDGGAGAEQDGADGRTR